MISVAEQIRNRIVEIHMQPAKTLASFQLTSTLLYEFPASLVKAETEIINKVDEVLDKSVSMVSAWEFEHGYDCDSAYHDLKKHLEHLL